MKYNVQCVYVNGVDFFCFCCHLVNKDKAVNGWGQSHYPFMNLSDVLVQFAENESELLPEIPGRDEFHSKLISVNIHTLYTNIIIHRD